MPAGEHEKRGNQTRHALLQAALDLLIESGGAQLPSVKAVCARVGHTRGAFYSRFESREEFVIELLDWVLSDVVGTVFAAAGADAGAEGVREVVGRLNISLGTRNPPHIRHDLRASYLALMAALRTDVTMRERHAAFMQQVLERIAAGIREGQKAGEFRVDMEAHHTATILVLVAVSAILWSETAVDVDVYSVTEALMSLLTEPPQK